MKFIFWGSPNFAKIILENLIKAELKPLAVVCGPDKPTGRKQILTSPPTKVIAQANNIPVFQPEKIDENLVFSLKEYNCDFFIVSAYSKIIPQNALDIPRLGTVGVHPSLLPKYRGASPIQSAILAGEKTTGTTLYLIDEKMDHGKILAQKDIPIDSNENYQTLEEKLAQISSSLLIENLQKYYSGKIEPKEQDHEKATFTKKFSTEDGQVDIENSDPALIYRKIKALNPDPGVYTIKDKKRIRLIDAVENQEEVIITKIIPEGKKLQDSKIILKKRQI